MCVCVLTYKAVCVLGSIAATCTLTMAAVTNIGAEATAVTLLSTNGLSYCGLTNMEKTKKRIYLSYNKQFRWSVAICGIHGWMGSRTFLHCNRSVKQMQLCVPEDSVICHLQTLFYQCLPPLMLLWGSPPRYGEGVASPHLIQCPMVLS